MRNLRKLFYVACAVFFFTSCEETYNDKLFWTGSAITTFKSSFIVFGVMLPLYFTVAPPIVIFVPLKV